MSHSSDQLNLSGMFNEHAPHPPFEKHKCKWPAPISVRVTWEEKECLQRKAGKLSLSNYVRQVLLSDAAKKRHKRYNKKQRVPVVDTVEIARLLGMFGKSELATSMLALSLAAQSGEFEASPEICGQLVDACRDIRMMKTLGVKPQMVVIDDTAR